MLSVSLDCPFWLPLRYSLTYIYHQYDWTFYLILESISNIMDIFHVNSYNWQQRIKLEQNTSNFTRMSVTQTLNYVQECFHNMNKAKHILQWVNSTIIHIISGKGMEYELHIFFCCTNFHYTFDLRILMIPSVSSNLSYRRPFSL
jgi:hypothetical protein